MMMETFNLIVIIGLLILFVVSFTLFIRRILLNASIRNNEANEIENKLDLIIEQNNRIISLMEKKD